jgi:hypothetical protein
MSRSRNGLGAQAASESRLHTHRGLAGFDLRAPSDRLIVSGVETRQQVQVAAQAGIPFGPASALRRSFAPPEFMLFETVTPAHSE